MSNAVATLCLLWMAGCGGMRDDLMPSSQDKRPQVQAGSTGGQVGQVAPDFTVSDSLGNMVTLSAVVPAQRAVVLYFTMWCPTCDSHMTYLRSAFIPANPDVLFYAVDYVSGSVAAARDNQRSNGYDNSGFVVLADIAHDVQTAFDGTMGTTVVIDQSGIVRMNEDFKDGEKLRTALGGL